MKFKYKVILSAVVLFFALVLTFLSVINGTVKGRAKDEILEAVADGIEVEYILVLGCGLRSDGSPSDMLSDRIDTAVAIYEKCEGAKILASGDHSREDYNEVGAIYDACVAKGVPEEDIILDHAGFSTYDSIWRAKNVYDAKKIIIVTQKYHLYRALYMAEGFGIEAYGVGADLREYSGQLYRDLREVFARVKDFYMVKFAPTPAYTGTGLPY